METYQPLTIIGGKIINIATIWIQGQETDFLKSYFVIAALLLEVGVYFAFP